MEGFECSKNITVRKFCVIYVLSKAENGNFYHTLGKFRKNHLTFSLEKNSQKNSEELNVK